MVGYIFPPDLGGMFEGLGVLILCLVIAYCVWQVARVARVWSNSVMKRTLLFDAGLAEMANKKGVDLDMELYKIENKKSFDKRLEEEVYDYFFSNKVSKGAKKPSSN